MDNQEKLLKEIKSLSDSIREKHKALKSDLNEREQFLESTFKPVTDPLNKLVKNIETPSKQLEGDIILPISKYEEKHLEDEETEESEVSEELEEEEEEEDEEGEKTEEREETEISKGEETFDKSPEYDRSNLNKLGIDIIFKGPLGRQYLLKMLHSSQANRKYHTYGARVEDKGLMIGDSKLDIDENDNIIIGRNKYKGTRGLFELVFKNKPGRHSKKDLELFKDILENTNAHRKGYYKNSPVHRNRSIKYLDIVSQLFPSKLTKPQVKRRAISSTELNVLHKKRKKSESTSSGKGLLKNLYKTNIIYYNDINKLVDRMRLLHEAMQAGHTSLDNEWIALVDELRTRGVIA